jgi:hypothetical protein
VLFNPNSLVTHDLRRTARRVVPDCRRRRLVRTTLGAGPARADASSDEPIVELWLRDRPANTHIAYGRDYGRFRAFIGARSLRTVGLGFVEFVWRMLAKSG